MTPPPDTPPTALPDVLAALREDLEHVGAAYKSIVGGISSRARDVVQPAARFSGKRLRPALTCLAARLAGAEVKGDVAVVAALVEMIHTATLVHDDVLDAADVRRKQATVNALYHDGMAVLAGDVLFSRAYLAAARLMDRFASLYLSETVVKVLEGEIQQDLASRNADLLEEDYRSIIRGKTAALYEAALVVGTHYGGAPERAMTLGKYGHHLGMAFQIVDDRLDLTGDESTVGKTLGRDLGEGKTTLPVILWLRGRPDGERDEARALVEAAWDDEEAAARLTRRLETDGALAAADAAAQYEIDQALSYLDGFPAGTERGLLEEIAAFVLRRRR